MAQDLCSLPTCDKPRWTADDGTIHTYCGRTHAEEALTLGYIGSLAAPHGKCQTCRLHGCANEIYFDSETGRVHDFCSRGHAEMAMEHNQWPPDQSRGLSTCALPGCSKIVYFDPRREIEMDYCGRTHARRGLKAREGFCAWQSCTRHAWVDSNSGIPLKYCSSKHASISGDNSLVGQNICSLPGCNVGVLLHDTTRQDLGFCSEDHRFRATARGLTKVTEPHVERCFSGGTTGGDGFKLSILMKSSPDHASVKNQFILKWLKKDPPISAVTVERIFKVEVPKRVKDRYNSYRGSKGNVRRLFHGTSAFPSCTFFVDLKSGPCNERSCAACNICTEGFTLNNVGSTARSTNFNLRYGSGLYFSSVSGKSNDYAVQSEKQDRSGKRMRIMFLCDVVAGKVFATKEATLDPLYCPMDGYDSILGEVRYNQLQERIPRPVLGFSNRHHGSGHPAK